MDNFKSMRDQFYKQIPNFWDRLYGTEYALYDCYELKKNDIDEIKKATAAAYSIFKKVNQLIRNCPEETLLQLGFPKKSIPFLTMTTLPYETVIGRFDFIKSKEGLKLIEFNADTPTFIRELFDINKLVCRKFQFKCPNELLDEQLGRSIRNSVFHCATNLFVHEHPYVVFTAHEEDIEDCETLKYLMKKAQIKGSSFVPLGDLQLITEGDNRGVYDKEGNKIDVVYRHTYPIEALIDDVTDDQFPIGLEFLKLVSDKKVGMLNPISAFLMQSKAVLALIWGMYEERHPFFQEKDFRAIEQYFLPTYLDEEPFMDTNEKYVSKPVFGREGNTVEIMRNGKTLLTQQEKTYDHYLKIYQKYVDLQKAIIQTQEGEKEAHLLIGSFVVNEKPSAVGIRAGALITDNLSYFLPCGVKGVNE